MKLAIQGINYPQRHFKIWFQSICFLVLLILISNPGKAQMWPIAFSVGGSGSDKGMAIAVDDSGYFYTAGMFSNTVDFDPGLAITNLTSSGGYDVYITKSDKFRNLIWAKKIGDFGNESCVNLKITKSNKLILSGTFSGNVNFNTNGIPSIPLSSNGGNDCFLLNLNLNGTVNWVKGFGSGFDDVLQNFALDKFDNIYATGSYQGAADFDPGVGNTVLGSNGLNDIFILKLDSAGNFVFAKSLGGTNQDYGNGIAVDSTGKIAVTGSFIGTIDFDPGPATYLYTISLAGACAAFVLELNSSGGFKFAKVFAPSYLNCTGINGCLQSMSDGKTIQFTTDGYILLGGEFTSTVDFNPDTSASQTYIFSSGGVGTSSYSPTYGSNAYIVKLDTSGILIWANAILARLRVSQMSSYAKTVPVSMVRDNYNNIYLAGNLTGPVVFLPSTIFGGGSTPFYLWMAKYDDSGNLVYRNTGGANYNFSSANGITLGPNDDIWLTGTADYSFPFQTTSITNVFNSTYDIFVIKLFNDGLLPVEFGEFSVQKKHPDVSLNWNTLSETNSNYFDIQRSENATDFIPIGRIEARGTSHINTGYSYTDTNALLNRMYGTLYYRLKQVDINGSFSYSPIRVVYLDENETDPIKLFPNPSTGQFELILENIQESASYSIYSAMGELVYTGTAQKGVNSIELNSIKTGVYYIQFTQKELGSKKLLKL
ncbi:MAG: hypothetical protein CFE21_11790 [Bacteroidetes bacterium B1(2017)]|nr:MAG: hypothetical protein CFE21_11790 [Bacteroidetes bacterium B1(2017)]